MQMSQTEQETFAFTCSGGYARSAQVVGEKLGAGLPPTTTSPMDASPATHQWSGGTMRRGDEVQQHSTAARPAAPQFPPGGVQGPRTLWPGTLRSEAQNVPRHYPEALIEALKTMQTMPASAATRVWGGATVHRGDEAPLSTMDSPDAPQHLHRVPPPPPAVHGEGEEGRHGLTAGQTSVIVHNIPRHFSQERLSAEWRIDGSYDYLHVPYSDQTGASAGFAIINFVSTELALRFQEQWRGHKFEEHTHKKALSIRAAKLQGKDENLKWARHSSSVLPCVVLGTEHLCDALVSKFVKWAKDGVYIARI